MLSDGQRTCIYRVVQEALTNCARHANATSVLVSISTEEGHIDVIIRDDGIGFNSAHSAGGLGLLGMRERVQALDGQLNISSHPSTGTTIRVQIPISITV